MKDLIEKKIRQCSAELEKLIPEWNKRRDTLRRIFAIRQGLFTSKQLQKMTTDFRKIIRSVVLSFQIPLRLSLSGGNFGGRRLVAGGSAKDPANEGLEVLLVVEEGHINGFEARGAEHSVVAFAIYLALRKDNWSSLVLC